MPVGFGIYLRVADSKLARSTHILGIFVPVSLMHRLPTNLLESISR